MVIEGSQSVASSINSAISLLPWLSVYLQDPWLYLHSALLSCGSGTDVY